MLIVNLKTEQRAGNYSLVSDRLLEEITSALQEEGKIVLFYNRKGYARRIVCKDCRHIFECKDCKRPLVAVKIDSQSPELMCTYCKTKMRVSYCPQCKGTVLKFLGFGLERIKQELEKHTGKLVAIASSKSLNIQAHNDIILATQIPRFPGQRAKGNPESFRGQKVQLAALLNADTDLYLPDFTAAVKTFNRIIAFKKYCLEISAPRALVQTYAPLHYAIYYGVRSDFKGFFKKELQDRKKYNYPPYCQLIKLVYQHTDQTACKKEAQKIYDSLRKLKIENSEVSISPPQPAFIPKARGMWRWQMAIKSKIYNSKIKSILQNLPPQWLVDVDPVSLL